MGCGTPGGGWQGTSPLSSPRPTWKPQGALHPDPLNSTTTQSVPSRSGTQLSPPLTCR